MKTVVLLDAEEGVSDKVIAQNDVVVQKRNDGGLMTVIKSSFSNLTLVDEKQFHRLVVNEVKRW